MCRIYRLLGYFLLTVALVLSLSIDHPQKLVLASDGGHPTAIRESGLARQFLETGIELYGTESYAAAGDAWSQAASLFAQQQDILGQALALNNLALAYQHLGQWSQSQQAIDQSLTLLSSESLETQPGYWEILAKASNTKGNWQWATGAIPQAAATWDEAAAYYVRAEDRTGIIKTRINKAKALQAQGLTVQAVKILETVNQDLQQQPDSELKATGLRYLGNTLRNIGKLERSATVLQQSAEMAQQPQAISLAWLELGNTRRKLSDRALAFGEKKKAEFNLTQAMQAYQKVETASHSDSLSLRARLNHLSLLVERGEYDQAEALLSRLDLQPLFALAPTRSKIYARLNYARSLTCLQWQSDSTPMCHQKSPEPHLSSAVDPSEIVTVLTQAIAEAHSLEDTIPEAQAMGQLAEVYELKQDFATASNLNQQALILLQGRRASDIAYGLEWQQARLLRQQQKSEAAIIAYEQAIASLKSVRESILFIDSQVQFDFRDLVEPVYREFTSLLLTTEDNTQPSQEHLRQAIKAIDALQVAELENYLGCDLSQLIKLDETGVDISAARIYPIILGDRLATIVEIPEQPLILKEAKISEAEIEATLIALQNNLTEPGRTPEVLQESQKVYHWLISPLEPILEANSQIKTLVFVPDSLLRNIPLSILYDGEQYLLEKNYALAVTPQLKLFAPKASTAPLKILTGGVDIPQTIEGIAFPGIEQVQQELIQIPTEVGIDLPLLNEEFTKVNIEQNLKQGDFSAIHWKTHGIFSSNPAETFLVAYQDSIKPGELQDLIREASQRGVEPIELLVLSACESARGDNRAVLGLAGLTVRTGVRTTLSTLWRADDRATTLLMNKFYQQLAQTGTNKAEALRQAQLSLMQEEGYFAPYYWGTYLLVGNWL